jgi:hypothetical protein
VLAAASSRRSVALCRLSRATVLKALLTLQSCVRLAVNTAANNASVRFAPPPV